jgi:signal transduction histidine kinase
MSYAFSIVAIRSERRALTEMVRVMDANEALSKALALERDRAEAASESKTRFFAAASHDLRQPLHALSINATTLGLVARRSADPLLNEVSQGIGSALQQSRGLLDGLLDISRLDAHAVQTRLAPHDMGAVLEAVREEYAALAALRGLTLEVDVGAASGLDAPWALTDVDQLLRIVGNLVDNALKFTREGGVVLSARRAPPSRVLVCVSDTGPGIAQAERERVFEEFYQVGNQSRDRAQGLGLGLAIVKRTAALLDIPLQLISKPGCGTTFELSLPGAVSGVVVASPFSGELSAGKPLSVLLVDDEPDALKSLCIYLREIGWTARGVACGDEAGQALAEGFRADVLVVDFRLHEETGAEVIRRLRKTHGDIPVVIVTGDTAAVRLREFSELTASVLHKPIDGERLARVLVEAVG